MNFIKERMATKSGIEDGLAGLRDRIEDFSLEVHAGLRDNRFELAKISKRLDRLEEQAGYMRGYSKEIDDLCAEVNAIKHHLGIDTQITA